MPDVTGQQRLFAREIIVQRTDRNACFECHPPWQAGPTIPLPNPNKSLVNRFDGENGPGRSAVSAVFTGI